MKKIILGLAALTLVACSETPPPKPVAKAEPAATTAAAPAPQAKPEPPKPDPNKELAARVKQALESEAKSHAGGIDVTANAADGKVSLWGTVPNEREKNRAAGIAQKVNGVRSVDNQIKVVRGS